MARKSGNDAPVADASSEPKVDASSYVADEHKLSVEDVAARYSTQVDAATPSKSQGLTSAEATKRLEHNGHNRLTPPKKTPEIIVYLKQYTNPLLMLVILACILAFVSYGIQDDKDISNIWCGSVLALVILSLGTTAYLSERAANKVAASLRNLLPSVALVVRDGSERQLHAAELVVGDVVHLTIGTRVPADLKIIESKDLKLDFSSLTGESDPIAMSTTSHDDKPHESRNLAFMSSQVLNGEGRGIVIRCGDNTFIGKINSLTALTGQQETTLVRDMNRFVKFIAIFALSLAITLFVVAIARGMDFADAFVNGLVVVIVANIPQGLPATVTGALQMTAENLKEIRVAVKKVDIVESLGSATRIASDKTGTLTQNRMTVMNCWVNKQTKSAAEILSSVRVPYTGTPASTFGRNQVQAARPSAEVASVDSFGGGRDRKTEEFHDIDELDKMPAPAAVANPTTAPKTKSSKSQRFGTDMFSLMSAGKASVRTASGGSTNIMNTRGVTFTVNMNHNSLYAQEAGAANLFKAYSPLTQLLTIACCNNKAQFEKDPDGGTQRAENAKVLGDATDCGLLRFADRLVDVDTARDTFAPVYTIPFNSKNKWALTMTTIPGDDQHYLVMIKGAPEYVMQRCSHYSYKGREHAMDEEFQEDMADAYEGFAMLAERVIGHAYKIVPRASVPNIPQNEEDAHRMGVIEKFVFHGLISLIDPPREAVPPAVLECRNAGIRVTMVTGDHANTAEAIARKCNIITLPTRREVAAQHGLQEEQVGLDNPEVRALVVTGDMINGIKSDEEWDTIIGKDELVFARTTPQQKLLIVSQFQRHGEVVAVTGDGVNDAPALRRANIGVAMGNPDASEVAREAADLVLLDDDFTALVAAIAQGRCLYDNLKKTVAYTLAHIPPETIPVVVYLALGMPLGLSPMLVLSIDLITEQGPASSLAFEQAEASVMARPPRNVNTERLVSGPLLIYSYVITGLAESLCCLGAYLWTFSYHGVPHRSIFLIDPNKSQWNLLEERNDPIEIDGEAYTPERQAEIVRQAATAWYITLILCQFWHVFVCKTRRVSIFKHPGLYRNRSTFIGVCIAILVMVLCSYIPWLQDNIFYTANPPGHTAWLPNLFFGVAVLAYTEAIKKLARERPNSTLAKWLCW